MRSRVLIAIVAIAAVTVALFALLQFLGRASDRRADESAARLEREAWESGRTEAREILLQQAAARVTRERQASLARTRYEQTQREEAVRAEEQRRTAQATAEREERERQAATNARKKRERQRVEDERRAEETRREAEREAERAAAVREREAAAVAAAQREADERARLEAERAAEKEARKQAEAEQPPVPVDDDTPDVETETTVDIAKKRGWQASGDLRPIVDGLHEEARDGTASSDVSVGLRARIGGSFGITKYLHVGTRLATTGWLDDFNPGFIRPGDVTDSSELESGETTFDQLFMLWKRVERFDLAVGRIQTRFVMRGGVYAKSLDRNDSHNWRVTWTDGLQANLRAGAWTSTFVAQHNSREGSGSIRRDPLDFDDDGARWSYFVGFESQKRIGPVVQRALDVSYLPSTLLKDGDPEGRRTDYWGAVGRLVVRWPPEKEGLRLRAGLEAAYAPETPTAEAQSLSGSGDVGGLAWNIVASAMDFAPGHSIGVNYARSDAGWLLSPQFRPNEELIELRYMWRSEKFPLFEPRIRRRQDIDQQVDTVQRRTQYDFFVRLTWRFTIKD